MRSPPLWGTKRDFRFQLQLLNGLLSSFEPNKRYEEALCVPKGLDNRLAVTIKVSIRSKTISQLWNALWLRQFLLQFLSISRIICRKRWSMAPLMYDDYFLKARYHLSKVDKDFRQKAASIILPKIWTSKGDLLFLDFRDYTSPF